MGLKRIGDHVEFRAFKRPGKRNVKAKSAEHIGIAELLQECLFLRRQAIQLPTCIILLIWRRAETIKLRDALSREPIDIRLIPTQHQGEVVLVVAQDQPPCRRRTPVGAEIVECVAQRLRCDILLQGEMAP